MGEYADYQIENYLDGRWGIPYRPQKHKKRNFAKAFEPKKNRGPANNFTKAKGSGNA